MLGLSALVAGNVSLRRDALALEGGVALAATGIVALLGFGVLPAWVAVALVATAACSSRGAVASAGRAASFSSPARGPVQPKLAGLRGATLENHPAVVLYQGYYRLKLRPGAQARDPARRRGPASRRCSAAYRTFTFRTTAGNRRWRYFQTGCGGSF